MLDSTPILVGCSDVAESGAAADNRSSPLDLMAAAARTALADAGGAGCLEAIDTVAVLRLFSDSSPRFATPLGRSTNPPKSVARRLGMNARRYLYTSSGGNMPQYLVNHFAESIADRQSRAVMIVGGEALATQRELERLGRIDCWSEDPLGEPETIGDTRPPWNDDEHGHGLRAAIAMYPLIENAIRGSRGRTVNEHLRAMGELFARFATVASKNPLAMRRDDYSAERLTTVDADNRWIGFPYPRLMNSNAFINQAAALLMMSVGLARELGIPETKWIFLHGCADANDHYYVSERFNLHSSPAIRRGSRMALNMAGKKLEEIEFFDLYSCFPSIVEIACEEMGLEEDDPRGLTITGGLPFFGGPGNNYVTHSIAEMMRRLRARPRSFGLVTANGNYVTKHSFGVYSSTPVAGQWRRESPTVLQAELDASPKVALVKCATGPATIETYTVMHGRNGPEASIVFGRLTGIGQRFIANTPAGRQVLEDLRDRESLGRRGIVEHKEGRNIFVPGEIA